MAISVASMTAADIAGNAIAVWAGDWSSIGGWIVLMLVALPAVGKVLVVWLALRNTAPGDRAAIINALADLLRAWRGSRRGTAR